MANCEVVKVAWPVRGLRLTVPKIVAPSEKTTLPAPERARPEKENSFVAPRNRIEETLAAIWAEVLGLERVGIHDNFFELGGHSLLVIQVLSRVRKSFQVEVSPRDMFETPTVAHLAVVVVQLQVEQTDLDETSLLLASPGVKPRLRARCTLEELERCSLRRVPLVGRKDDRDGLDVRDGEDGSGITRAAPAVAYDRPERMLGVGH